jgi:DNA mismatch repair ATPase MutS
LRNKYLSIISEHEAKLKKVRGIFSLLGYGKLFFILLTGFLIFSVVTEGFSAVIIISAVLSFAVLAALWVFHNNLQESMNYSNGIIEICNRQTDRINGKWASFKDDGAQFLDSDHLYAADLDIVGAKSLFQLLNTTGTWHGRQFFSEDLLRPAYNREEILIRQEAIAELSADTRFSCKIQYHLSKIGVNPAAVKLAEELKEETPFIENAVLRFLLSYVPALTCVFLAVIFIFKLETLYITGAAAAFAQALVWVLTLPKTHAYLGAAAGLPYKLSDYAAAISLITGKEFKSEKLNQIKEQLVSAEKGFKWLGRIADKLNIRQIAVLYYIFNILLLWDLECAFSLREWKKKYALLSEKWFASIGEFESLLSFSHLPNICAGTCMPEIIAGEKIINAELTGHPLLANEKRVCNDFNFNGNILIISGSNMSGKTTFLRTVGINLVLAKCGSFVCAKRFACSVFEPAASMRITDDLNEGLSTFYAELKRIKKIIDTAKGQTNMLFLIDEIFRGTNSVDRLYGAKTVLSKLHGINAAGLISTHDLELCELAEMYQRVENFSFSETYEGGKIIFDYKIRGGKSTTTNAKYLMEMVGI